MTPEQARERAERIVRDYCARFGESLDAESVLIDAIAAALVEAATVADGMVRIVDRDVRVLGELPMTADGCVVGRCASVWTLGVEGEPVELRHPTGTADLGGNYSTRAAAEQAAQEGKA